jgi:hypothetical protein
VVSSFAGFAIQCFSPQCYVKELIISGKILFVPIVLFSVFLSAPPRLRVKLLRVFGFPRLRFGYGPVALFLRRSK